MKFFSIFAGLLFMCVTLLGQNSITGVCVNSYGEPVEYASIRISDTRWVKADLQGYFSLNISDTLRTDSLTFVHVSYDTYSVSTAELRKEFFEAQQNGRELKVILTEFSHPIDEVVVFAQEKRWSRIKNLNSRGIRMPLPSIFSIPSPYKDREFAKRYEDRGIRMGMFLHQKRTAWLRELEFESLLNTFDSLILRVVVYRKDSSGFIPMMKAPLYISVPRGRKQKIYADLTEYRIQTQGTLYIGIESVDIRGTGSFVTPTYVGTNESWVPMGMKNLPDEPKGLGLGLGFIVRGCESK